MARLIFLVLLSSLIKLSLQLTNIEILHSPKSIIFQNTTDPLSSSDLSKFINQCLGYTTKRLDWNGFYGYKNIVKDIPKSVIVFHMPISLSALAVHSFPIEIDSNLHEQFDQTKDAMQSRHNDINVLNEFVSFVIDKNSIKLDSQIYSLKNFISKLEPRNGNHPALLWFEIYGKTNEKEFNGKNIEGQFQKIINHLLSIFGNDLLVLSIHDDQNQIYLERATRQIAKENDTRNLAYEYAHDFHTAFVSIGFTALLFVLAVFIISVSMWNIDPGRDSIIYRLTSQKIKKDQ